MISRSQARQTLPELITQARAREVVVIGNRGVPEVALIHCDTPVVPSEELFTLVTCTALWQARSLFERATADRGPSTFVPDSLVADTVVSLAISPATRQHARRYIISFVAEMTELCAAVAKPVPTMNDVLQGIAASAGADDSVRELLHQLVHENFSVAS